MAYKPAILVIDNDDSYREFLVDSLEDVGYKVKGISDPQEAVSILSETKYSVVLLARNNQSVDTLQDLQWIKKEFPSIQVLILSRRSDIKTAFHAIRLGAFNFFAKSSNIEEFIPFIDSACKKARKSEEKSRNTAKENKSDFTTPMIGNTPQMESILNLIRKVAPTDSTVLVTGETGVGKELVAQTIHDNSFCENGPFVVVNCGAIPDNLLESELFGHEKGAYTDASGPRRGLMEEADGGTMFLDEISEVSPTIQVKLLRAVETEKFRRLGSNREIHVNARIIAATNRNLLEEVKNGRFRADLYYRLAVINIDVPSLRERIDDISLLVDHFIGVSTSRLSRTAGSGRKGVNKKQISPSAMKFLMEYDWPGNIRELKNIIERLTILSDNEIITPYDLAQVMPGIGTWKRISRELEEKSIQSLEWIEREHIKRILMLNNGHQGRAAETLGISPRTLYAKVKRYSLDEKVSKS